jgi:hypothetical protein
VFFLGVRLLGRALILSLFGGSSRWLWCFLSLCFGVFLVFFFFLFSYLYHLSISGTHNLFSESIIYI